MEKYIITGKKSRQLKQDYNTVLQPVDRKKANLEAENRELAVTISNPSSNILELFKIGGKRHSKGGTPLNLQEGNEDGTDGASFIFSDTPKMKIKDPEILKFFNMNPKVAVTPAQIGMQYIPLVNKSKFALMDEDLDPEAKTSHIKNLDNAAFKIAALALYQESKKGMPNGYSSVMQPFFNKTNIDPAQIFSVNNQDAEKVNTAIMSAFGGDSSKDNKSAKNIDLRLPIDSQERSPYNINGYAFTNNGVMGAGINPSVNIGNASINPYLNVFGNQDFRQTNYGVSGNYNITPNFSISGGYGNDGYNAGARFQFATGGQLKKYDDGGSNKGLKEVGVQYDVPDLFSALPKDQQETYLTEFNNNKDLANQYLYISSLENKPGFKDALFKKYEIVSKDDKAFGRNYVGNKDIILRKDPNDVYSDFVASQYINLKNKAFGLKSDQIGKGHTEGNTTKYLKEWATKNNITLPDANNTAAQQLSYQAFNDLVKDQGNKEYSEDLKGVLSPFEAIKEGEGDEDTRGVKGSNISKADGYIGDTWALETARFKEKKKVVPGPVAQPDEVNKIDVPQIAPAYRPQIPFGYRKEDLSALSRAQSNLYSIDKISPWAKVPVTTTTEAAYYDPTQAINANLGLYKNALDTVGSYASPEQTMAALSNLQGKTFADTAATISNYADKNVGIFNQTEQQNTALANAAAQQSAQMQTSNYDKQSIAKQEYKNSIEKAKDKINQLANQAWTNATNIFNLNQIQKQFVKDPYSGLITQFSDKPIDVTKGSNETAAKEFMDFRNQLKTVPDAQVVRLWELVKNGKITVDKDTGQIEDNTSTSTTSEKANS